MRLIINAEKDDFILAVRAASSHLGRQLGKEPSFIVFEDGTEFLVQQRKAALSVTAVRTPSPDKQ